MSERRQYFDDSEHFWETVAALRQEKRQGAIKVGIFGSRARGTHTPLVSDTDILSIRPEVSNWGDYDYQKGKKQIHIVRIPPQIIGNDKNSEALRQMANSTRWLWAK